MAASIGEMRLIDHNLRLRRRHCEEQRRRLAELQQLGERLRADAMRLQTEIERMTSTGIVADAQAAIDRHAKVRHSLAAIEAEITGAASDLAEAERELRGYERAFGSGGPARDGG